MASDRSIDSPIFTHSQDEALRNCMLDDGFFQSSSQEIDWKAINPMLCNSNYVDTLVAEPTPTEESTHSRAATSRLPSVEKFQGVSGFHIACDQNGDGSWVFSSQLNKMFAKIFIKFPVKFVWKEGCVVDPRVRVVLLFQAPGSIDENVERCILHTSPTDSSNLNFHHMEQVVRCDDHRASYCADPKSLRNSVVVPLDVPQAGTDSTTVMYSFVCHNSCPSGINRRATQIVFTLEDASGRVHGRDAMGVRICSCPKRDKEKEEAVATDKLADKNSPTKRLKLSLGSNAKIIKTEAGVESLTVSVVNEVHRLQVVKAAHGHLLSNLALQRREPSPAEQLCLAEYTNILSR